MENSGSGTAFNKEINEIVRDILGRYHQVSQEAFRKIISDKDSKYEQVVKELTSQILAAKEGCEEKDRTIAARDATIGRQTEEISELKQAHEKELAGERASYQGRISLLEKRILNLEQQLDNSDRAARDSERAFEAMRKEAEKTEKTLRSENERLGSMLEESIDLAERFYRERAELIAGKRIQ